MSQRDTLRAITLAVRSKAMRLYFAQGVKTTGTYQRQVWRLVREFHKGEIDEFQFIDDFSEYIDNQFGRAWRQGAREMGVNPNQFRDADIDALAERIGREQGYMLQLGDDIMRARENGQTVEQFRARAEMYANRYEEVVNEARIYFGGKMMLEWIVGPTEHCGDCARLNGTVASADEWAASGWKPQSRNLECGGWRCQCQLIPTDKAPSPAIPA